MGKPPIPLDALRRQARELDPPAFRQRHPTPYLLVEPLAAEETGEWSFETVALRLPDADAGGGRPPAGAGGGRPPADGVGARGLAYAVQKDGVANPNLVTIGRTRSSDVRLESKAISKLHAYFSRDPIGGGFTLTDAGSTNGTEVAGQRLAQGKAHALQGGEEIILGRRFRAIFLMPEQLQDFLNA